MSETPSIALRPSDARGRTDLGWLDSRHTFSFGGYADPQYVGHRALRVINDDRVAPGRGFGMHGHADMEIVSVVLAGALAHRDDFGHEGVVEAGCIQYMSAGNGVRHSEFNASDRNPVHFLQIWIEPSAPGGSPRYEELDPREPRDEALCPLVTGSGRAGSIQMRQDAEIIQLRLAAGGSARIDDDFPHGWLHLIEGSLAIGDLTLGPGDGIAFAGGTLQVAAESDCLALVFRLR